MRHSITDTTKKPASGLQRKGAMILVAALIAVTIAGAIAANSRTDTGTRELGKQTTPAFILNLPGGFGVEEALY